ncbi:MAG: DUF1499 domain-containing protein [Planctomycetia bacterium]|nr:DUF1499 domain-containing protein [Planctomycetia bacterium]
MHWLRWFTRNWADTSEDGDAALVPPILSLPLAEALVHIEEAIGRLRRWRVEKVDSDKLTIHACRQTRLLRFVDDILIRLEPTAQGTRVHLRSQSRVGVGDFGQNRRNLQELLQALAK